LLAQLPLESWQEAAEEGVEVVPWEIVQEHLELRQLVLHCLAEINHDVDDLGHSEKSIGTGGTTQVRNGKARR